MISKPFAKPRPPENADPMIKAGWSAEQDAAFRLDRAFGDPASRDVRVFHDVRFPVTFASGSVADGDFFQIDHLVLHRHGTALVESKSVVGDLHVDKLGQWQHQSSYRTMNIASPVTQVQQQADALKNLLHSATPLLMNKLLGIAQKTFTMFPTALFVAIADRGRFTGTTTPYEKTVMKVDQIVDAVTKEIRRHRNATGFLGVVRSVLADDKTDAGVFNLQDDELDRIEQFLLSRHTPLVRPAPASPAAPAAPPAPAAPAAPRSQPVAPPKVIPPAAPAPPIVPRVVPPKDNRVERLESLSCSKCRSVNVRVVFARDYCLKCEECGKFSPLPYVCPLCGKHASIRKSGPDHFRACDGPGGCGMHTLFWRAPAYKS